jgi:hypothetical protein
MTVPPDGRPLLGDVVRLDRLRDSDIEELYAAIGNEQVYAAGFEGGLAGMPADAEAMRTRRPNCCCSSTPSMTADSAG